MKKTKRNQWLFTGVTVVIVAVLFYVFHGVFGGASSKEVSYSDFLSEIRAGHLTEVRITEKKLIGML